MPEPISPPPVAPGDTVWVEYRREQVYTAYPPRAVVSQELQLRAADDRRLLWVGTQGFDASDALVRELFGVPARAQVLCGRLASATGSCEPSDERLDHTIQTSPPQHVPYGRLQQVTTDKGRYDVIWIDHAVWVFDPDLRCADLPLDQGTLGFAASLRLP